MATTVVFYDGVCGLCNRFVRFLLRRDPGGRILFAPLQGETARTVLTARGHDPSDLDTIYVVADWQSPQERVLSRSRAVLHTLALDLGRRLAFLVPLAWAPCFPRSLSGRRMQLVARRRYRTFGRLESCPVTPPVWRDRFLE